MSSGEHSHTGLAAADLQKHLDDCNVAAHEFGEEYVHKHFADCLEGDPNATMFEDEGINVVAFKIWMTIAFFLLCIIGLIPKAWPACSRSETALSLLNCFSAGIFLAMALLHMMPEGVELYNLWVRVNEVEEPFPLPYTMFLAGYILVLFVDRGLTKMCGLDHVHGHGRKEEEHTHYGTVKADEESTSPSGAKSKELSPKKAVAINGDSTE